MRNFDTSYILLSLNYWTSFILSLLYSLSLFYFVFKITVMFSCLEKGGDFFFFGWILLSTWLTVNLDKHCLDFFLCCLDRGKA